MKRVRKIIEDLLLNADYKLYTKSVEQILSGQTVVGYKIYSCDTLHLRKGRSILLGPDKINITNVKLNEYVEVEATTIIPLNTKEFTTYPVYFYSGTLKDTHVERLGAKQIQENRTPFLWVKEPYEMIDDETGELSIETTVTNLTAYLLDECMAVGEGLSPNNSWNTVDHHTEVIEPMLNFFNNRVLTQIKKQKNIFGDIENKRVRGLVFVGSQDNSGNYESLFHEKLSGIEVRLDLPLMRDTLCDC